MESCREGRPQTLVRSQGGKGRLLQDAGRRRPRGTETQPKDVAVAQAYAAQEPGELSKEIKVGSGKKGELGLRDSL